ncbi:MAG: DUF3781 domain-containing protein [Methanobrevibacter sp.]|uniref:DUF3781 domain-containing protein n=1 Tax=Methanobrevibacter millerae TaxID=230361 RepID=A0A8T3VBM8_9EURY|nr:DUF3781 domain-containing protein [Methanobrevibacter millerae]MBE6505137.1 DUF3781 domain-containing protein [Methanobrevibacter millerae]MBR0059118.1 DUF3781 domain-containing protein [Methanobrevibacter sp.]
MHDKDTLIENIDKVHTTEMGIGRISKNLGISGDVVEICKEKILKKESLVERKGKNYYVDIDDCIITVNASSFTIITAHKKD